MTNIINKLKDKLYNLFNLFIKSSNSLIFTILLFTLFFAFYIIYVLDYFSIKNNKFTSIGMLLFIFMEMLVFFYFLNKQFIKNKYDEIKKLFIYSISVIIIIILIIYLVFYIVSNFSGKTFFSSIILIFLSIFLIITILSIIYLIYSNSLFKDTIKKSDLHYSSNNNYNFIKNIIFFIPCLLIDFMEYITSKFRSTPKIGYILLIQSIILLLLILKLPSYINNINKNNLILKGPVYINNKKELGVYQEFTKNIKPDISKYNKEIKLSDYTLDVELEKYNLKTPFSYNYQIDFEIYLNPQPSNTNYSYNNYTNIISYGKKPQFLYYGKENKIKIICQTEENKYETIYETVITNNNYFRLAKWNKINIKYDGANMDIIINSHLVGTKSNIIPFMNYDKIVIGEDNGLYGGIKNIYFYNNNKPVYKIDKSKFDI